MEIEGVGIMMKHYVTYLHPGMICADVSRMEIETWNVDNALKNAGNYTYGFYFTTFYRGESDWEPSEKSRSGTYFINGTVKTLEEVKNEDSKRNENLIWNMETNHWNKVVVTNGGFTQPFLKDDVNLRS
jgi:hypothetical protein